MLFDSHFRAVIQKLFKMICACDLEMRKLEFIQRVSSAFRCEKNETDEICVQKITFISVNIKNECAACRILKANRFLSYFYDKSNSIKNNLKINYFKNTLLFHISIKFFQN